MKFVDKILNKIDEESVIKLYKDGLNSKEIQNELNISENWIKDVVSDYERLNGEYVSEDSNMAEFLAEDIDEQIKTDWVEENRPY